jgi:hypothetical protein
MEIFKPIAIVLAAIIGAYATIRAVKHRRIKQPSVPNPKKNERVYQVEGTNEDGTKYSGLAYLRNKNGKIIIRYFIGEELWIGPGP